MVILVTPEGERSLLVGRDEHILEAARMAGIDLPAICRLGRCLTCAGKLLEPGEVDQSDSSTYFPLDREAGFVLLCTGRPRSGLKILTHQESQMREHRLRHGLPAPYS